MNELGDNGLIRRPTITELVNETLELIKQGEEMIKQIQEIIKQQRKGKR